MKPFAISRRLRSWRRALAAVAVATTAAGPAWSATDLGAADWRFAQPSGPGAWQALLSGLGLAGIPSGARLYQTRWISPCGGDGEVDVLARPDGAAFLRTSWTNGGPPIRLEPGDLDPFESALRGSDFGGHAAGAAATDTAIGVDCYVIADVVVQVAGRFKRVVADDNGLSDAVDDLIAIANARTGRPRATPSPWWVDAGAGPAPPLPPLDGVPACAAADAACRADAWQALLAQAGLAKLPADLAVEAWACRLILFRPVAAPAFISLEPNLTRRGARLCAFGPCVDTVLVRAGGDERVAPIAQLEAIEGDLARAGFATAPVPASAPAAACPGGAAWVLEAMVGRRYRYLTGPAARPAASIQSSRGSRAWPAGAASLKLRPRVVQPASRRRPGLT